MEYKQHPKNIFNKKVQDLTLYESAVIASLLKAPSRYNPISNFELSKKRASLVLNNMIKSDMISIKQVNEAKVNNRKYSKFTNAPKSTRYFVDWLLPRVKSYVGEINKDLIVRTTLDIKLQKMAEESLINVNSQFKSAEQSSLVALDLNGGIIAMIGGTDYGDTQFNRVTQAKRQPGSAFKLFVYLAGLENGYNSNDILTDSKVDINGWSPKNYKDKYIGDVTLEDAFSKSINTVAVKISESIGREKVIKVAKSMGITSPILNSPSLALGTSEVTLLELTSAYNILANNGEGVFSHGIRSIEDTEGEVLFLRKIQGTGKVLEESVVWEMTRMLEKTINSGTGKNAKLNRPAAGKTGTSQSLRDAWFVGFTSNIVVGVWFGNDNDSPMKNITGGTAPAILWREFMVSAHENISPKGFKYTSSKERTSNKKAIDRIIKKSEELDKRKNLFESILDNFF